MLTGFKNNTRFLKKRIYVFNLYLEIELKSNLKEP